MNWIENMNNALAYIENNLDKKITLEEVAKIAYSSKFHFARTFTVLTDMNLFDYIRYRRLTVAVKDLKCDGTKVMDVAFKYGYETPESFSKAFKKMHGISPSKIISYEGNLNAVLPLSISVVLKGDEKMNYKIVEKDCFDVVGFIKRVTTKDGENYKIIPMFWNEVIESGKLKSLIDQSGPLGTLGVIANYDEEAEEMDYYIAVEGKTLANQENQDTITIPSSKWAIFESVGPMPEAIQNVWKKIYSEWFPATQYQHAGTAELEVYHAEDTSASDYKCEVWIPIKDK